MLVKSESVGIDKLRHTSYNPKARTEIRALKTLTESMKEHGQLMPVSVNGETMELIDGNRRLVVARSLGLSALKANVYYKLSKNEARELFATVNDTQRRHSTADMIWEEHHGGSHNRPTSKTYADLKALLTKEELDEVVESHKSARTLALARGVCNLVGRKDEGYLKKVLFWILRTESQRDVGILLRKGDRTNPRKVRAAIENNRPVWPRRAKKAA